MRKTPQTGPTRASAKAVSSLGLRCVGALATQHACSRLHYRPAPESDVLNGRQPRRGHEPASASARACVVSSAARVPPPTSARTDLRVAGEPSLFARTRVTCAEVVSRRPEAEPGTESLAEMDLGTQAFIRPAQSGPRERRPGHGFPQLQGVTAGETALPRIPVPHAASGLRTVHPGGVALSAELHCCATARGCRRTLPILIRTGSSL